MKMDETRVYTRSMEKVCPLCGKTYTGTYIAICPLAHCPTCGSSNVRRDPDWGLSVFLIAPIVGFIAAIFSGLFLAISFGAFGVFLACLTFVAIVFVAYIYAGRYECANCTSKFLFPKRKIPLRSR